MPWWGNTGRNKSNHAITLGATSRVCNLFFDLQYSDPRHSWGYGMIFRHGWRSNHLQNILGPFVPGFVLSRSRSLRLFLGTDMHGQWIGTFQAPLNFEHKLYRQRSASIYRGNVGVSKRTLPSVSSYWPYFKKNPSNNSNVRMFAHMHEWAAACLTQVTHRPSTKNSSTMSMAGYLSWRSVKVGYMWGFHT